MKDKIKYVDGFVITVPKSKTAVYKKMAKMGRDMWIKHGALDYKECIGDDLHPKGQGGFTPLSFLKLGKAKPSETIWFSFIGFKSKKHRDSVNKKVMSAFEKDPKSKEMEMPFDMNLMAYGGFEVMVSN